MTNGEVVSRGLVTRMIDEEVHAMRQEAKHDAAHGRHAVAARDLLLTMVLERHFPEFLTVAAQPLLAAPDLRA